MTTCPWPLVSVASMMVVLIGMPPAVVPGSDNAWLPEEGSPVPSVPGEVWGPSATGRGGPEGIPGGETCLDATVIPDLPFHTAWTTTGYQDDYDETCPNVAPGSPDAVYVFIPADDVTVDISLCHPGTGYDTKLYVYRETCPGERVACDDDDCPGYLSRILGLSLTQGQTYFIVIDGYGGEHGPYELTVEEQALPPTCPAEADFSQPPLLDGPAGLSESTAGYVRYESYETQGVPIETFRFWGLSLEFGGGGWQECFESPKQFEVKFYADQAGEPGEVKCEYLLNATGMYTGRLSNGYRLYQYDAELGTPCDQTAGWVSIRGVGTTGCWFLWAGSDAGDARSLVNDGTGLRPVGYDLAVCLTGTGPAICPGDLDCDGVVSFGDINPFVLALANWPEWKATYPDCPEQNADINRDGQYGGLNGFGDINPFVELLAGAGGYPIPCP